MTQYRVKRGSIGYGEFSYQPGDIIEVPSKNHDFDTNNWVERVNCSKCPYYQIGADKKPSCGKFGDEDHRDCNKTPFR